VLMFVAFLIALTAVAFSRCCISVGVCQSCDSHVYYSRRVSVACDLSLAVIFPSKSVPHVHCIFPIKFVSHASSHAYCSRCQSISHSYHSCVVRGSAHAGQAHSEFHQALEHRFKVPPLRDTGAIFDWVRGPMLDQVLPPSAAASGYFAGVCVWGGCVRECVRACTYVYVHT
jgi:hypothetical protein